MHPNMYSFRHPGVLLYCYPGLLTKVWGIGLTDEKNTIIVEVVEFVRIIIGSWQARSLRSLYVAD